MIDGAPVLRCHCRMAFQIMALPLSAIFFLSGFAAHAQVFTGPAASAAGGAGRASVDNGEASFLNPAAIGYIQHYNASVFAGVGSHPVDGNSNVLAASLADGTFDAIIPGALTYVQKRLDANNGVSDTQSDIAVTIAGHLHRKLAFGVTGHRLSDQLLSATSGASYTQYNANVGALYVPVPNIGLGLVGYDVGPGDSSPVGIHVVPTYAFGVNYLYEKFFRARLDLVRPDTNNPGQRINMMLGLETFFAEEFAFRVGGLWRETADQDYLTAGLGYKGPKLSLDYSFQKDVRNGENGRHLIDLWLPL